LTTGESQPSDVKYGVLVNGEDADAARGEGEAEAEEGEEGEESVPEEDEEGYMVVKAVKGVADVPFEAKSAERVRSACGINVLLPVRSARR
jgi:hypothetical protein